MSAVITPVVREGKPVAYGFKCPGCGYEHHIVTDLAYFAGGGGPVWSFNGSLEKPSFMPSLLCRHDWEDHSAITDEDWGPWEDHPTVAGCRSRNVKPEAKHKLIPHREVCHSYVSAGHIKFLGDCTHKLAGQTVPLAPVPVKESEPEAARE